MKSDDGSSPMESTQLCVASVAAVGQGLVVPLRCGSWSCPVCAPLNALREAARVAYGMRVLQEQGHVFRFVTLTQPGKIRTPERAYCILPSQFDKFRNRWQYSARKRAVEVHYAGFVEGQPRRGGMPHFHIVGTALPSRREVREWAVRSGFGYQADCQPLNTATGVAWYVAKYCSKSSDSAHMPKFFRRVRYSRGWPAEPATDGAVKGKVVARKPGETALMWSHRCAMAHGGYQSDYIGAALLLLDRSMQRDGNLDHDMLTAFLKL